MGNMTRNLSRHEFECHCGCKYDTVDWDLPAVIQDVLDYCQDENPGKVLKVNINSGTRCHKYNAEVGGKQEKNLQPFSGSMHLYGKAADFYIYYKKRGSDKEIHINEDLVADYLERRYPNKFGIGRYKGRTHVDTRQAKSRWDRR